MEKSEICYTYNTPPYWVGKLSINFGLNKVVLHLTIFLIPTSDLMLQVSFIRENKERVLQSLRVRNYKQPEILDEVLEVDEARKAAKQELDQTRAKAKKIAKTIGGLYKQGKREEAEAKKKEATDLRDVEHSLNEQLNAAKDRLEFLLLQIPNAAHPSVPAGRSDEDNLVHQEWQGELPELDDEAQPHWELAKQYNLIDFELGSKITGSGFPLYLGMGAKLQRALVNFFLAEAESAGYMEFMPPHIVNEDSVRGTGQFPDKEGQMYYIEKDDLYLIPTAEVPVTNIYRDYIFEEQQLPLKLTAYTPCFRREAGSYGKEVRGLNRLHQFDKVELVQIQHPEHSYEALQDMCQHVEQLLQKLELPYRILLLCGGDLGFTSALTYDFETYSAAQKRWLEVSSVSNFENFQAKRLKMRYKDADNKKHLVHTLNGSALALPRILATLLENNQTAEGIRVPKVLQPFVGTDLLRPTP